MEQKETTATPCDTEGYPFSCRSAELVQIPVLLAGLRSQRKLEAMLLLCEPTGLIVTEQHVPKEYSPRCSFSVGSQ